MSVAGDLRTKISNLVVRSRVRLDFCEKALKILDIMSFTLAELRADHQLLDTYIATVKQLYDNVLQNHRAIEAIFARVKDLPNADIDSNLAQSILTTLMVLHNIVVSKYTQVVLDGSDIAKHLIRSQKILESIQISIGSTEPMMPDRVITCDKCGRDLEHHYADYSCMSAEDAARVDQRKA